MTLRSLTVRVLQAAIIFLIGYSLFELGRHQPSSRTTGGSNTDALRKFLSSYSGNGNGREGVDGRPQNDKTDLFKIHNLLSSKDSDYDYKFRLESGGYKWYTESVLRNLAVCSARGDCHPNAHKVVIIGALQCHLALFNDYHGGEGVWCMGIIDSLQRQGYTVLLARNDWAYMYHIYRQIPDLVTAIIADAGGNDQRYETFIKNPTRPDGIPAWKFFFFFYYPNRFSTIVGNRWVVSAEPAVHGDSSTYLGYSLEIDPKQRIVPFNERPHQVYLLGKYTWFFRPRMGNEVWKTDYYQRVTDELRQRWPDFEIIGAIFENRDAKKIEEEGPIEIPKGIRNLVKLNATEFDEVLGNSRLLLGIGHPGLSPSPYRALARGVPFLNPKKGWYQHNTLGEWVKEPYNYNVEAFQYEEFRDAIVKAMETPAEPWIAPWMTQEAMDKRMRDFMNTDWRSAAAVILEERKKGNETQNSGGGDAGKPGMFEL